MRIIFFVTLFAVLLTGGLCSVALTAETPKLTISMQERVPAEWDKTKYSLVNRVEEWKPEETAVIVCDMWDKHWCKHSTARFTELAAALEPVLKTARDKGVLIVHAPSETMKFYANTSQRKEAIKHTDTSLPTAWEKILPSEAGKSFPISSGSHGGCEDSPKCKVDTHAWTRQSELITIGENDIISDSRQEIAGYFKTKGIKNVILTGVATNMCVIGRPFGLRAMKKLGMNVVLMRDMTDTMFNSEKPKCDHHSGNDLMVDYIETYVCPSIVSSVFTGKKQYRFSDDKRKRIAFVMAEGEYRSDQWLPEFARELTLQNYRCDFAIGVPKKEGEGRHNIENLQISEEADLMVISVRRRALPTEQMTQIKKYVSSGKPLLGIKVSCVAFAPPKDAKEIKGLERWDSFDQDVWGGNYGGYDSELRKQGTGTDVSIVSGKEEHPLLKGVKPFHCADWLYRNTPLRSDKAEVLLRGKNPKHDDPVFWTNGDKVIYTSLGHWNDWELEPFRKLMFNAVDFLLKSKQTEKEGKMAYRILDFMKIDGVPCPCGLSRRGLLDEPAFPGTIHRTDIDRQAKPHYHKKLTEIYYVISCEEGAVMQLDDERIPLHNDMAFYIPPGTVHCLIGKAKTCIFVLPKYDPEDEYIVE